MGVCLQCRKIPRDLTEASLSGAGISIIAALWMVFLFGMVTRLHFAISFLMHILHLSCFGMRCIEFAQIRVMGVCASAGILQELNNYLSVSTMTSVVVDRSRDGEYLRIDFNLRYVYLRFLHQCVVFCTSASLVFQL